MREIQIIMGMPVSLEITDKDIRMEVFDAVFDYLKEVDERFSTYKEASEISRINRGEIRPRDYSGEMKEVLELCEKTKDETRGYFDIRRPDGTLDPSGLVKGLAIERAAELLRDLGVKNFCLEVAGDIQCAGKNGGGEDWSVGIRNPFRREEIVKVVYPKGRGVATSGTYIRGEHIYDPHSGEAVDTDIISLTVIGPDIYEADRFATAAFAMGRKGISFMEEKEGFEAYAIDKSGVATYTSGFDEYIHA